MILSEYNEELHIKNEKSISYEEGVQVGIQQGIAAVISVCRKMKMEEAEIVQTLMQGFSLSEEEARKCLSGAK